MVKDSEKWKDYSEKKCGNRDEESDVEVEGEETRSTGGTSSGNN